MDELVEYFELNVSNWTRILLIHCLLTIGTAEPILGIFSCELLDFFFFLICW